MTSPPPNDWQELLAGYALGNLNSEEAEALQRLLTQHPELNAELDRFQEVLGLVPQALPQQTPPPSLRETILNAAQSDPGPRQLFQPMAVPRQQRVSWGRVGGAIAAVMVLALGGGNYRLWQETQRNQSAIAQLEQQLQEKQAALQNTEALLTAFQQPGAVTKTLEGVNGTAFARIAIDPNHTQGVLLTQNLQSLPPEQIYRLWSLADPAGTPLYCGQFNITATGTAAWTIPATACNTPNAQLLISIERIQDPTQRPRGTVVMQSQT